MSINLLLSVKIISGFSGYKKNSNIKYPQGASYIALPNIEVFFVAIKSYSSIEFNKAYILLDVDGLSSDDIFKINKIVHENINAGFLSIQFERPSNKSEWINFIKDIDDISPYLVCMNHDMVFTSSNEEFQALAGSLKHKLLNSNTLLTYCHIPEMVAWATNDLRGHQFLYSNGKWESKSRRHWIDGIYLMSRATLLNIFELIIGDGPQYLPRYDWPGVVFNKCEFNTVVVPVNLFSHYDGSTHVLCSQLKESFRVIFCDINESYPIILFNEFIEIFHIALAFWFLIPRFYKRKKFNNFLITCCHHFVEAKKLCNKEISEKDHDNLLGLIIFYENHIYNYSLGDSKLISFPFKSYFYNKIKRLANT
ncbi:hypothetical protein G6732_00060 [Polynucleobacter paneuropaeus]|nr:hypothetical protein [Polynucleobacter paneuropaeus]